MYFFIIYISVDLWRFISSLGYNPIELYFLAQNVSTLAVGSSFSWLLCPCRFDKLPSVCSPPPHYWLIDEFSVYFLTFWCHKMLWAHYLSTVYISWPSAWISVSPRSPGSFYWEMVTNQDLGTGCACCSQGITSFRPSQLTKQGYLYVY